MPFVALGRRSTSPMSCPFHRGPAPIDPPAATSAGWLWPRRATTRAGRSRLGQPNAPDVSRKVQSFAYLPPEKLREDTLGRVVIVGQGYVRLPLAMRAVEVGYDVVGFDTDESRIGRLAGGESFVADVSSESVREALATSRYHPTTIESDCADFDVAVIDVPTPLREGVPDLSHMERAATALGPFVRPGSVVILESTTYPGTTEELIGPLLQAGSGLVPGVDFHLGYSPERIDPGNARWNLINTPK